MMSDMMPGMMWGMGLLWLLVVFVLILSAAALIRIAIVASAVIVDLFIATYRVTTADGKTRDFWERNLRFKTDVSGDGPQKGAPAIVAASMVGDRADVIFAAPEETSGAISPQC